MFLSFLIFFMMPDGAKKRPAAGNLTPLKKVTRVIMREFIAKIEAFNLPLIVEFCKNLIKKGYTNTDLEMTVDEEDVLLSNEIAKFQRGKLEGIFQGSSEVADMAVLTITDRELNDNTKVGNNLKKVLDNQEQLVTKLPTVVQKEHVYAETNVPVI